MDNTFIEVYWMDGRVVMTSVFTEFDAETAGIQVFATGKAIINSFQAWSVKSIWVPTSDL